MLLSREMSLVLRAMTLGSVKIDRKKYAAVRMRQLPQATVGQKSGRKLV